MGGFCKLEIFQQWYDAENRIWIYPYGERRGAYFANRTDMCYMNFIIHETGHAFDNALKQQPRTVLGNQTDPNLLGTASVNVNNGFYGTQGECWQRRQNGNNDNYEVFADQFIGWVNDMWEIDTHTGGLTTLGNNRKKFMDKYMLQWIKNALGTPIEWNHW